MESNLLSTAEIHKRNAQRAGDIEVDLHSLIDKVHPSFHEAYYILDCREMAIVYASKNFGDITGLKDIKPKSVEDLYENLTHISLDPVLLAIRSRLHVVYETNLWSKHEVLQEILELQNGRRVLKTTFILNKDQKGITTHTGSVLSDVTQLVGKGYRCQFIGPNSQAIWQKMNGLGNFSKILSNREIEILGLIGQGLTSLQIGNQLFISKHTVDTHRRNILKKLEVGNSQRALDSAMAMGIFKI